MSKPDYLPENLNINLPKDLWLTAVCPVCKRKYPYLKDYKPGTCGRFECIYELAMRQLKREGKL